MLGRGSHVISPWFRPVFGAAILGAAGLGSAILGSAIGLASGRVVLTLPLCHYVSISGAADAAITDAISQPEPGDNGDRSDFTTTGAFWLVQARPGIAKATNVDGQSQNNQGHEDRHQPSGRVDNQPNTVVLFARLVIEGIRKSSFDYL